MNSSTLGLGLTAKQKWAFTVIHSYYPYKVGGCYLENKVRIKCVSPEVLDFSIQRYEKKNKMSKKKKKKKRKE